MSILNPKTHKKFVLAGNAIFTIKSTRKDARFTYKVKMAEPKEGYAPMFFVSVLTGPDNWENYKFFGFISMRDGSGEYKFSDRSAKIGKDSPAVKGFEWFWQNIENLPEFIEVWHEGKCGRCARRLTVPDSIASGFGPECVTKI